MKKWFVGLLMMAMALVMIPSVVMAETEVSFYCPSCCEQRTGIKSDTYEYFDQNTHRQRITCKVCNYKGMSVSSAHTETKAATCQSAAYCADCKSYYGSKAEHNWGDWTTDEKTHKRTCQTPGCGAVDTGSHTSEPRATCKTEQTCGICNVQYKDLENHEGEVLTHYSFISESQHMLEKSCSSCGDVIFGDNEAHTETKAATCQSAAYCGDCKSYYGSKAEHNWGDWTTDEKTHKRTCQTPDCGAVDEGSHTWGAWTYYNDVHHYRECTRGCGRKGFKSHSGGKATCNTQANCEVCHEAYGNWDVDNHEHTRTSYANATGEQHWVTVVCEDCNQTVSSTSEAHTWGDWTADGTTHTRTCQSPGCGAVDTGSHTSEPKATCKTAQTCAICNVQYKDKTNHEGERKTAYYYSESQHVLRIDCSYCGERISMDYEAHTETTAATCTTAAYCADCKNYYGDPDPDAHDLVQHAAQASTCGGMGWDAYETCSRCDYTTYVELPALGHDYQAKIIPRTCEDDGYTLHTCTRCADRYADTIVPHCGHWYGEWTANGDGTQRAECLRGGCHHEKTVDCEIIELPALNISLCPVCGTASDGSRLALTNASVKIVSGRIPHGEALLRVGTLANGEKLLTVGYVYGGQLSKASCQVRIALPAELLAGYTLSLLNADGTETALEYALEGDFAVFTLTFAQPLLAVRLTPAP